MKYSIIVLMVLLSFNVKADWSVAYGIDVIHAEDPDIDRTIDYGEIRYRGSIVEFTEPVDRTFNKIGWTGYVGKYDTVGLGIYAETDNWIIGWGVEYAEPNELTSTEQGYELLVEYKLTDNWALSLKHRSNCRDVCTKIPFLDILPHGDEDSRNRGLNYLTARYTF